MLQSLGFAGPVSAEPLTEAGGSFVCGRVPGSPDPALQVLALDPIKPPLGMRLLVVSHWRVT